VAGALISLLSTHATALRAQTLPVGRNSDLSHSVALRGAIVHRPVPRGRMSGTEDSLRDLFSPDRQYASMKRRSAAPFAVSCIHNGGLHKDASSAGK